MSDSKEYPPDSLMGRLKGRKIIATLAAFVGSGVVIIEVAHHILVNHYHLPHQIVDICIVTLVGALIGTLIWRWFRSEEKRHGNVKIEVLVVPLIILLTLVIDLKFIFVMTGISINMLLIGIAALCLGIAWVLFKSLQWAASVPEAEKKAEVLKPIEEKPIGIADRKNSIAVLPFTNISADPEQEYFCDGITEEIINALTHVAELKVIARTSSFMFKGKHEDIREIGKELDVGHIVEGSVRKAENRLRITAQLIIVGDGSHLWSEKYDREMKDIFDIQDEISLAIVSKLKMKLFENEKAVIKKRYTENLGAYNLYLEGRHFFQMFTLEGFRLAIQCYEQAISKDLDYALVYAGLADAYFFFSYFGELPPRETAPKAKKYLKKALDLDESLAEAHASLARIHTFYDWNWGLAEREYRRALELKPNASIIHFHYSSLLMLQGRHEEAILAVQKARELDPLSVRVNAIIGERKIQAGQYDEAIEVLQKTITMAPNDYYSYFLLGCAYQGKSMLKKAIAEYEKALDLSGESPMVEMHLAGACYLFGDKLQGDRLFKNIKEKAKHEYVPPLFVFWLYKVRGDTDLAYKWLEKACKERDIWLPFGPGNHIEAYRIPYDRRSKELMKKMGFIK